MRKLIGGAAALGVATAGTLALAGPGSAQTEAPPLVAEITVSGNTASISSIESCPATDDAHNYLNWAIFEGHSEQTWQELLSGQNDSVAGGMVDTEDGSWSLDVDLGDDPEEALASAAADEATERSEDGGGYGPLELSVGDADYTFAAACGTTLRAEFTSHETLYDDSWYLPLGYAEVEAGDDVRVEPLSNCPAPGPDGGSLWWAALAMESDPSEVIADGVADLAADGSWEIALTAPGGPSSGFVFMYCLDADGLLSVPYGALAIVVGEGELPEVPPVPPVRPATPIVDDPPFTG